MKKLLLLTLLPFFTPQQIPCTYHSCDISQIQVKINDQKETIQLFNIQVIEERYLCQRLQQANTITLEKEPFSNEYYVFVDGTLLQKELLSKGYARLKIANPTYQYGQEMIDASRHIRKTNQHHKVMFQPQKASVAILYWFIILAIWLIMGFFLKKRKIS